MKLVLKITKFAVLANILAIFMACQPVTNEGSTKAQSANSKELNQPMCEGDDCLTGPILDDSPIPPSNGYVDDDILDPPPPQPEGSNYCGGPADPRLYRAGVRLYKAQHARRYPSYEACHAARADYFGNALVCSKMVAATIFSCLMTADYSAVIMEFDLALPVFVATGRTEFPYDYYLLRLPNCERAKNFLNEFSDRVVATNGQFSSSRTLTRAYCVNSDTAVIRALRIYD